MHAVIYTPRIHRIVLAVILSLAAVSAGAQNMLVNGTFDQGMEGWSEWASEFELVYHSDVGSTLAGGSGPGCMEVQLFSWIGGALGPLQEVAVTGGASYTLGGSVELPDSGDNLATLGLISVCWSDPDRQYLGECQDFGPAVTERGVWIRRSNEVTAPAGAAIATVKLLVGTPNVANETRPGVAYFDDIVFMPAGTPIKRQELFIPAAASAHGRNGTFWTTTGWFVNRTGVPLKVEGAFLYQEQDNSGQLSTLTLLGTVPARGYLEVRDLVAKLGAAGKTGGVYLVATAEGDDLPDRLVEVTSYTFTPNPGGSGSYGQGVPAVERGTGGQVVIVPGVYQDGDHRTNIGVLNTSGVQLDLIVNVYGKQGDYLGTVNWNLMPYEQRQVSVMDLGVQETSGGYVFINQRGVGGSFLGYATVVDQQTGDAVYTPGS